MGKEILYNHLIVFISALSISAGIILYSPLKPYFISYDKGVSSTAAPDTNKRYYPNYDEGYQAELTFRNALTNKNSLVFIGSSEMTRTDLKAISYNLFNSKGVSCFGFGHEGNQSLAVMTQLAVFHNELKNSNIVIIVSPGWFEGGYAKGTSLQSFLEFVDERFLYLLYFDKEIPAETKDYIYHYLEKNYKNITSPSAILRLIYYTSKSNKNIINKLVFSPFCSIYRWYCERKMKIMTNLFYSNQSYVPFTDEPYKIPRRKNLYPEKINWDSLKNASMYEFKAVSNNNPYGIENTYYNKWMKGADKRTIKPVNDDEDIEFQDFTNLLAFLKTMDCKPYFVIQPLNPLVYTNMHDIDPILTRVQQELQKNKFSYVNLHVSDENKYVKGILADYQHLGNLGWYEIDEKVSLLTD